MEDRTIVFNGHDYVLRLNTKSYYHLQSKYKINNNDEESLESAFSNYKFHFDILKEMFKAQSVVITDEDIYKILDDQFQGEVDFMTYATAEYARRLDIRVYKQIVSNTQDEEENE